MVSLGIVAGATLVFLFMIEHFKVWETRPADPEADPRKLPEFDKVGFTWLGTPVIAGRVKYSLAFVVAAAVGFFFLSNPLAAERGIVPTPVYRARGDVGYLMANVANGQPEPGKGKDAVLYLDADLTGWGVKFYHQREVDRNGGEKSCVLCHHMNMPHDKYSGCYECHRDMYLPTDAFRHDWHASPTGGNLACVECHARGYTRSAEHVKPCTDCHKDLVPEGSAITVDDHDLDGAEKEFRHLVLPGKPVKVRTYIAVSYVDAMHELCIGCHAKVALKENKPAVAQCAECHKGKLNYYAAEKLLYHRRALAGRLVVLPPAELDKVK